MSAVLTVRLCVERKLACNWYITNSRRLHAFIHSVLPFVPHDGIEPQIGIVE